MQQGREPPAIEDYLPADGEHRSALLLEMLSIDISHRSQLGCPANVDRYLQGFPEVAESLSAALATGSRPGSEPLLPSISVRQISPPGAAAASDTEPPSTIAGPAARPGSSAGAVDHTTRRLGRFTLLRALGRGGGLAPCISPRMGSLDASWHSRFRGVNDS